jgi:membrane-associated protease RseP (regulator of RpoE activity)
VEQAREQTVQEIKEGDAAHAFYRLPPGKKILVMAGGPVANILFAAAILLLVFVGIGIPRPTAAVENVVACVPTAGAGAATPNSAATPLDVTDCGQDGEPTPASLIGLQPGDEIISLAGIPTPDWPSLSEAIAANAGRGVDLVYQRSGEEFNAFVSLAEVERVDATTGESVTSGFLGIAPAIELQRQSPVEVPLIMGAMTGAMFEAVATFPARVADVARAAAGEERDPEGLVGIIGASRVGGEIAASETPILWRAIDLLVLLAGLNVALAIFNLIPLPPLDGGHIAGALFEAVRRGWAKFRGKPVPQPADVARLLPFAYGVVAVLIGISILVAYADIVNPIRLGG